MALVAARRITAHLAVALTVAGTLAASLVGAAPAGAVPATISPVVAAGPGVVRNTPLPTAQIDGIVWAQAIVGNTVYAGGKFANARPAGSAPGVNNSPRTNLMSYNLTTGALNPFAPVLDGVVYAIAGSPDGTRVYVAGAFGNVNGMPQTSIVAFDTATGSVIQSFDPTVNYYIKGLSVTNDTVYIGGAFGLVNGRTRTRLAALSAADGSLLPWNPSADATVNAVQLSPSGNTVVIAGALANLNGTLVRGLGAVSASTGVLVPYAANQIVYSYGTKAAFLSLSTDGQAVYGTSYNYGGAGNLEGTFSADPDTGALNWVEDCFGDTYSAFSTGAALYTVSHAHDCRTVGGFTQVVPGSAAYRAMAWTTQATGTVQHDTQRPGNDLFGNPSPSIQAWYPTLATANVSGSNQAAWSVTGNSKYLLLGGEFPSVDNVAQQGLVRFAVTPISPDTDGPRVTGTAFVPTASSLGTGADRIAFVTNYDRDDLTLNYTVERQPGAGGNSTVVWTTSADSVAWKRPTLAFADTGLTPGAPYQYRIIAKDAKGNAAYGAWTTFTAPSSGNPPANQPPVASATVTTNGSTVSVDGSGSSDPDGQVSRYAWTFGDGATASTRTATHTYAAAGTYPVTLTVTDDRAATATATYSVTVTAPNVAPTASFTAAPSGRQVAFDGSASNDPDGTIAGYAWDFGDGQTASGAATQNHTYAVNGTYTVTLTVTDNLGATGTTSQNVTAATTPVTLASDGFGRSVSNGWGTADIGGAWTVGSAPASSFGVANGTGLAVMATPGATPTATLAGLSLGDTDARIDVALDKLPNPGAFVSLVSRRSGANDYRLRVKVITGGQTSLAITKVTNNVEAVLASATVGTPAATPGAVLHLRLDTVGSASVTLSGRFWVGSSTEPTSWQVTTTDSTGPWASGAPGLATYLSGSATNAPVTVDATNLTVSSIVG